MNIEFAPRALRDLRRLDPPVARHILDVIDRYAKTGSGDVVRHRSEAYR